MLAYILSCTISKLLRIIGQIFAFDNGEYLSLTHSFWETPITHDCKIWRHKKLETSLYRTKRKVFRYLEQFRRGSQV